MKKQIKYLLSLAVICITAACTETVSLDGSVDKRVNAVINGYIDELSSSEDGWIANVMTDEGIYRFWMSFTDKNMVTMYTDNLNYQQYQNESQTTTYNIRALMLPTLSFDTYSYIHIINDPDDNISGGSNNQGLNTDFEFEINSYKDGVFMLTGRISHVPATLTRATAEEKAFVQKGGLMTVLKQTIAYKKGKYLQAEIGGSSVGVTFRPRSVNFMWLDNAGKSNQDSPHTIIELNRNVILDKPANINGIDVAAFLWDDAAEIYTLKTADGTTIPVTVGDTPAVSLYDVLGADKTYKTMLTTYDMYADEDMTKEQVQEIMNQNAFFKNYVIAGDQIHENINVGGKPLQLAIAGLEFYMLEGRPRLMLTLYLDDNGGLFVVRYSYPLTFDNAKEQFTIGTTINMEDGGNSQVVYSAAKPLCDFFKSSTFQSEWSQLEYGTEIMGQLRLIPTGTQSAAIFYGALN